MSVCVFALDDQHTIWIDPDGEFAGWPHIEVHYNDAGRKRKCHVRLDKARYLFDKETNPRLSTEVVAKLTKAMGSIVTIKERGLYIKSDLWSLCVWVWNNSRGDHEFTEKMPDDAEMPDYLDLRLDLNWSLKKGWVKPNDGEQLTFGGYDWRILDQKDGKALLLSEKIIGRWEYKDYADNVDWENCGLREYLNGAFYRRFPFRDQERIAETRVINGGNPWYGTSGGNDTSDKIFCLSIEEAVRYFGDSGLLAKGANKDERDRFVCWPDWGIFWTTMHDQYSEGLIALDASGEEGARGWMEPSWWWLRSPGSGKCSGRQGRGQWLP